MSKNFLLTKDQRAAAIKVAEKQGVKTIYVTPRGEDSVNYFTVKNLAMLSVKQDAAQVAIVTIDEAPAKEGGGDGKYDLMTPAELKALAGEREIKYPKNIKDDTLRKKLEEWDVENPGEPDTE